MSTESIIIPEEQERMNIVIVGHVDHGKSTLIGRLLADTGTLPKGKLEQVKARCERNAKPFEYAFLLDALKDEQAQGITIDTARSFFKTKKRHYIIIDAPGHIEFLKNMITGAARAQAALLLIDAHEGVQENSRRHGFMLSLLGIRQIVVLVNKMDLVNYDEAVYRRVVAEYQAFLDEIHIKPKAFVPIAAREGKNLTEPAAEMPWYKGKTVLDLMDDFTNKADVENQPFRMPVQDIYKFTEKDDDRRIVAGTVETGWAKVGDKVIFYPSQKTSRIKSVESFNTAPKTRISAGQATGVTLTTQIYIRPGELMCKEGEKAPEFGNVFKANIFWLGKKPMTPDKKYKLKTGTARATVYLKQIINVLDAAELVRRTDKPQVDRHDVAECLFETVKPISFDLSGDIESTSRFVIIDDYEIAGGGIITESVRDSKTRLEDYIEKREYAWTRGNISPLKRAERFRQTPKLIVITGERHTHKFKFAKALEETLFNEGYNVYYLGISNILIGIGSEARPNVEDREEHIRRLGELAHLFNDAGMLLITVLTEMDDYEASMLKTLSQPHELIVINVGESQLTDFPVACRLDASLPIGERISKVKSLLVSHQVLIG